MVIFSYSGALNIKANFRMHLEVDVLVQDKVRTVVTPELRACQYRIRNIGPPGRTAVVAEDHVTDSRARKLTIDGTGLCIF
jgi:hypothetical protein